MSKSRKVLTVEEYQRGGQVCFLMALAVLILVLLTVGIGAALVCSVVFVLVAATGTLAAKAEAARAVKYARYSEVLRDMSPHIGRQ